MTLVSIIIPYFNSGATIEKTIASAKTQSWSPLEIIVINDGSTDKTKEYAIKTGAKIIVWVINKESHIMELIDYGVDGLIVDDCLLLKKILIQKGLW